MKHSRFPLWLLFVLFFGYMSLAWGQPLDTSDPNRETLEVLLEELDQKIDDADKRMVAHPTFLDELRALVERYEATLREIFLIEDFSDGDYTQDPTWVVESGNFRITGSRKLRSSVTAQRPASTTASSSQETDAVGVILKGILEMAEQQGQQKSSSTETREAVIYTLARIGPFFEVDINLISNSQWGAFEIVLLGGEAPAPRYRITYHVASSAERPIEIIREREGRSYIIDSARQYPVIDDGKPHRIQWIRNDQGRMRVLVDGEEVIETIELSYRDDFAGLALVNRGGEYKLGPIKVSEATRVEQN